MYVSKYYTCEEIDQRLLQGYYDDSLAHGFVGTLKEFWAFFLSIANKVDKKEGWDLSENNFSDELLEKLNGIEEHANYVTKVSQLENDLKYQTQEQVEKYIHDLVDGADDALDTLKELAEALNNDPNFATNITNRLTELRTQLEAEVTRAKNRENELASQIKIVNDNLVNSVNTLNATIIKVVQDITRMIEAINARIQKVEDRVGDLEVETDNNLTEAKEYAKELVDKEAAERRAADEKLTEAVHQVQLDHTRDIADLNNKILTEASERANADVALESKLNTEISDRKTADQELESKINAEAAARTAQDEVLHQQIVKETSDRQNADNGLQQNITQEAQNRQNADTVLQNNIDNEKETRIAQDEILDHKIEDLKTQAGTDKTELLEKLEQEKQERIAADKDLDNRKVDKREGYSLTKNDFTDILKAKLDGIEEHANYITKVSQLINDAGYQTEADLQAAIEKIIGEAPEVLDTLKEIADALGNDPNFATTITKKLAAITEQLNQEITNRTEADAQVQANVDKEVSDRKEADTALEAKLKEYVDNEVDKITGNTDGIQSSLNKEIQDRKDADAALQAAITKEETDRKAADAALDTRVTANATKIQELALSIQDAVNTVKNELQAKIDALQTEVNANKANIQRNTDRLNDQITKEAEDYAELKGMVNAEAEARANADTNLKSQVDKVNIDLNTEVSKREAGDTVLQQNIDKEISDRTAADTLLDNKFTGLINTESTARANEDEKINARIDQEIKDRKAGDDALSTRIDSLNSGVTGSLDELREKVTNNTTAIQTEVERAKAAEQALKDSLTTAMENHKDDLVAISKDINDEAQSRLQEDTKLQNNIDTEILNRTQADTLLENKITQEVSDRVQAVENLNNRKVDKVDGKELSSNDFTDLLKAKLDNIQEFANYITKVSQLENDSNYQNAEQVEAAIQKIIGSAPGVLDTLEEIAKALGDDPNFATTITNKLTELKGIIDKEISDRTAADEQVTQKFTELSTTLNATVSELRTFVTETRSELLTKAQAQDELIAKNTANIQRNLELIQGLQSNQNTGYLEIKELLNTEIEARKAEDIRIEAKVDKNTQDLKTEKEERIEADKVLQDNIEAEEAARKAADQALDQKFTGVTETIKQRLNAEEAVSAALPEKVITNIKEPQVGINKITLPYDYEDKNPDNNQYSGTESSSIDLPSSTSEKAGLQTAEDKKLFDSIPDDIVTGVTLGEVTDSSAKVDVNKKNNSLGGGVYKDDNYSFNLPVVSSVKAGIQTAADKKLFDSIPANLLSGDLSTEHTVDGDLNLVYSQNYKNAQGVLNALIKKLPIPVSEATKDGLQSAEDKKLFDSIPTPLLTGFGTHVQNLSSYTINYTGFKKQDGVYVEEDESFDLEASTPEKAGLQSAADKKLFDSLPETVVTDFSSEYTYTDDTLGVTMKYKNQSTQEGVYKESTKVMQLPVVTEDHVGLMGKDHFNRVTTLPSKITVTSMSSFVRNPIFLSVYYDYNERGVDNKYIPKSEYKNFPVAETKINSEMVRGWAGLLSGSDKLLIDSLPASIMKSVNFTSDANKVTLSQYSESKKTGHMTGDWSSISYPYYDSDNLSESTVDLPVAASNTAGVMTAEMFNKLNTGLDSSIAALEKKHDDFVATKGKPNGFASLDANGLVPSSQLPSYVDDVLEVYATYDISPTGELTNIKLYGDAAHSNPITGESGKIYVNVTEGEPSYQFRWTGTQFIDSNTSSLILGEITGTAFDGGRGKALEDWRSKLPNVVKGLGFEPVDNYAKLRVSGFNLNTLGEADQIVEIPVATSSLVGLMDPQNFRILRSLPRNILTSVGLEVESSGITLVYDAYFGTPEYELERNFYRIEIPQSTNTLPGIQSAFDKKEFDTLKSGWGRVMKDLNIRIYPTYLSLEIVSWKNKSQGAGYGWESNSRMLDLPAVTTTKAGVMTAEMYNKLNTGLDSSISDALDAAKAYTDAAKTALNNLISTETSERKAADTTITNNLNSHTGNTSNPHKVTKAQVGLGNVQNLAPADMPVSTAQATAIADAKAAGTKAQTDLSTHANRKDNPHNVTRAQLGLATTDQVVFAKTTAASGFWKESDGRLKSQVENLNHTLDQICNIPTVHFKMNGKYQVGTIAQSLEEIEPLLVSENNIPASQVPNQSRFETFIGEDGQEYVKVKVVEYEMLSVMALEGVKLLRKEFEDFKKQLNNK